MALHDNNCCVLILSFNFKPTFQALPSHISWPFSKFVTCVYVPVQYVREVLAVFRRERPSRGASVWRSDERATHSSSCARVHASCAFGGRIAAAVTTSPNEARSTSLCNSSRFSTPSLLFQTKPSLFSSKLALLIVNSHGVQYNRRIRDTYVDCIALAHLFRVLLKVHQIQFTIAF